MQPSAILNYDLVILSVILFSVLLNALDQWTGV